MCAKEETSKDTAMKIWRLRPQKSVLQSQAILWSSSRTLARVKINRIRTLITQIVNNNLPNSYLPTKTNYVKCLQSLFCTRLTKLNRISANSYSKMHFHISLKICLNSRNLRKVKTRLLKLTSYSTRRTF